MNSEAARPSSAATAPVSARPLPGWWVILKLAQVLTPVKVMEPSPFGSFIVSPGSIICASLRSLTLYCLRCFWSSW